MTDDFVHTPVMAQEILDALRPVPTGLVVDATVGGGGHAASILEARPDVTLLGIDRDPDAVEAARSRLARFGERVTVVRGGFEDLGTLVARHRGPGPSTTSPSTTSPSSPSPSQSSTSQSSTSPSVTSPGGQEVGRLANDQGRRHEPVVAVVFDLGVSSPQLDRAERGFSYRADAPLDMRMDPGQQRSAADVVNGYAEADLRRVITRYGEERFARSVARAIVRRRPIGSTLELAEVIKEAIPAATRRTGGHPAKRTFQAIRIEVNAELAHLEEGLDDAFVLLGAGGRLAVLSYHSLEDRIVKLRFGNWATGGEHPRGLPVRETARDPRVRLVQRGTAASPDEIAANPRARSARLRVVEKLPGEDTGS